MRYQVVITDNARDDLREIKRHFLHILKSPDTGKAIIQELKRAMKSLESMPMRHTVSDKDFACRGIKAFPVNNYIVFYIVVEQTVSIIRVLHSSRNWIELI